VLLWRGREVGYLFSKPPLSHNRKPIHHTTDPKQEEDRARRAAEAERAAQEARASELRQQLQERAALEARRREEQTKEAARILGKGRPKLSFTFGSGR
jgi:hypothetical protein